MKKLTAIWILAIMLFNSIGYRALMHYLQQQADEQLQARIDTGDYSNEALLELSVPLNLPYTTNWTDWEHYEGDIQIEGIHYRYVERKLADGKMYVRCLPNTEKQTVMNARDVFFKMAYDIEHQSQGKKSAPVFVKNFIGDYDDTMNQWQVSHPQALHFSPAQQDICLHGSPYLEGDHIPPEMLS